MSFTRERLGCAAGVPSRARQGVQRRPMVAPGLSEARETLRRGRRAKERITLVSSELDCGADREA